jgi:hypothetical protein
LDAGVGDVTIDLDHIRKCLPPGFTATLADNRLTFAVLYSGNKWAINLDLTAHDDPSPYIDHMVHICHRFAEEGPDQ